MLDHLIDNLEVVLVLKKICFLNVQMQFHYSNISIIIEWVNIMLCVFMYEMSCCVYVILLFYKFCA